MELSLIIMVGAVALYIAAQLLILLTPALFYSTMAYGGGMGMLEFSAGRMSDSDAVVTCVMMVLMAWMLWKAFWAWRTAAQTLRLI